jgi:hypothetical protein
MDTLKNIQKYLKEINHERNSSWFNYFYVRILDDKVSLIRVNFLYPDEILTTAKTLEQIEKWLEQNYQLYVQVS